MNRLSERLLSGALVLFLLAYVGYQAYRYYYSTYKTEAVFEYAVAHSVKASGVAIRDEQCIEGDFTGVENCIFDDATWVSVGQPVVEYYRDKADDQSVRRIRDIESEIALLESAQDPSVNSFFNTEALSRDIKEQLASLAVMSSTGWFEAAAQLRPAVTSLINRRQISIGKEQDFSGRIELLKGEQNGLSAAVGSRDALRVTAPVSGYFVREVDGLEALVLPQDLKQATLGDLQALLDEKPRATTGTVGKIVRSPRWYFVATLPKYNAQWLTAGMEAELLFDAASGPVPVGVIRVVQEKDADDAIAVFQTDIVSDELLRLRFSEAIIQLRWNSGLRVNTHALRFQDGERGVFVLKGNEVCFRKVDPVYEEPGFILSREHTDPADTGWVSMFDLIITGTDLYDGKIIS